MLGAGMGKPTESSSTCPSQTLKGRYVWWMESLTSSRSGMMARHLSEVLRSHCDQILLCPCFIVVTAWEMLGFVLPTVAIHHLRRKRTRARWHFAFPSLHPQHTHTYPSTHAASCTLFLCVETSTAPFLLKFSLLNYLCCFSHTPLHWSFYMRLGSEGTYVQQLCSEALSL